MSHKKLISIVIPIHNEAANVPVLHDALSNVAAQKPTYDFEFIFIDDGSTDNSVQALLKIEKTDRRLSLLQFSRNFGKEAAVSAGLQAAGGDAVVVMDADMQHPPAIMPKFIEKWEQGAEVVVGIKRYSKKESLFKRTTSSLFYRLLNSVSQTEITPHASDYRLLDRCVVDTFNQMTERNRMTRGLIDWLGFDREYIDFVASPRLHGEASYTVRKLVRLALNSFTSYSLLPLKAAGYLGVLILVTSGPVGAAIIGDRLLKDPMQWHISGTAVLAVTTIFLVGVILASLGLVALYIAHIHAEVTNRPLYVLRPNSCRETGRDEVAAQ